MYIDENYDNYKYLVQASDNFVVLTNQSSVSGSWDRPDTIDIIYQYFEPSFLVVESEKTYTNTQTFTRINDIESGFFARPDCLDIIKVQFLVIFFVIFVLNALTRFVRKGGVFFGE